MTFYTKIIGSSEPASKRSPCFVRTSQTGNWSQGKLGRTSAGITRSDLNDSVALSLTTIAKKNYLVELLRHTGVPLFVDSYCSITKRKFAGSPEKKQSNNIYYFKNKIIQNQSIKAPFMHFLNPFCFTCSDQEEASASTLLVQDCWRRRWPRRWTGRWRRSCARRWGCWQKTLCLRSSNHLCSAGLQEER